MCPESGSAPAEDDRVGGESAVVPTGDRSSPADPDADVAEVTVEHSVAVDARVQPAVEHLAWGVLVAQDLGEPVRPLAPGVAGLPDPAVDPRLALASVPEAVVGEHRLVVALRGQLQPPVGLERGAIALRSLFVDQAGDRLTDLGQGDLMRMGEGVGTCGPRRGDPGP